MYLAEVQVAEAKYTVFCHTYVQRNHMYAVINCLILPTGLITLMAIVECTCAGIQALLGKRKAGLDDLFLTE